MTSVGLFNVLKIGHILDELQCRLDTKVKDIFFLIINNFFCINLEHEGMITELPQLHNCVHQRFGSSFTILLPAVLGQHDPLLLHVLVEGAL